MALLRNKTVNTVIVDFSGTPDLRNKRNPRCKLILEIEHLDHIIIMIISSSSENTKQRIC